jgi:hypothetical protein
MNNALLVSYDSYEDYLMGHAPQEFMNSLLECLANNPGSVLKLVLASGETEGYLLPMGGKLFKAGQLPNGGFELFYPVRTNRCE